MVTCMYIHICTVYKHTLVRCHCTYSTHCTRACQPQTVSQVHIIHLKNLKVIYHSHDWMFLLVKSMPQPHNEWPRLLYSAPSALRRVRETLTTSAYCIFYCKLGMVRIFLVWRCASRIVESCLIWSHLFLGPAPTWSHPWSVANLLFSFWVLGSKGPTSRFAPLSGQQK